VPDYDPKLARTLQGADLQRLPTLWNHFERGGGRAASEEAAMWGCPGVQNKFSTDCVGAAELNGVKWDMSMQASAEVHPTDRKKPAKHR
jgi:hypothetical protein